MAQGRGYLLVATVSVTILLDYRGRDDRSHKHKAEGFVGATVTVAIPKSLRHDVIPGPGAIQGQNQLCQQSLGVLAPVLVTVNVVQPESLLCGPVEIAVAVME